MGNFDLKIDVDTNGIERRLDQAISSGVRNAADEIADELRDKAEQKITRERAIWRKELIGSFDHEIIKRPDGMWVRLSNVSGHAGPVEHGAEYEERGPPVHALLPWVRDNLRGFELDGGQLTSTLMSSQAFLGGGLTHPEFPGYTYAEVDKAFWLQRKIKRDGIAPVGFMAYAERWARRKGHDVVSDNIEQSLRKYGLI